MTTVHANDPRDALSRLETMILMAGLDLPLRAIRDQIVSGLDLIVHLARSAEGARRVVGVTEVQGLEGDVILLQDLFLRAGLSPTLEPTGLRPRLLGRLAERGVEVPAALFRNDALLGVPASGSRNGHGAPRRPSRVAAPPISVLRRGSRR